MYIISKLTGNIYLNGIKVPLDDSTPQFQQYLIDKGIVGVQYIESTPEEIAEEKKHIYLERLQNYSIDLRLRAKASAIGKKGSRDYIFAQVEMYELKCKVAKGIVSGQYFTDLLTNEAIEFGLSIEDFKALIILRYDTAEATYQQFLFMIEICRTFIQTLIENNNFTKVDSAFALIDMLDAPEQAQSLMASILEL
jgi:hypothetical protein